MIKKIYFAKVQPHGVIPSKRDEDGAFDIYAAFEDEYILLEPHETKLIPTGIASSFSDDYVAILKERGSTGTKGIGQRCGVIDSGYRGEWFVPLTNHNNRPLIIGKSAPANFEGTFYSTEKAIAQCLMVVVPKLTIEELDYEQLKLKTSLRGVGALGSSGK